MADIIYLSSLLSQLHSYVFVSSSWSHGLLLLHVCSSCGLFTFFRLLVFPYRDAEGWKRLQKTIDAFMQACLSACLLFSSGSYPLRTTFACAQAYSGLEGDKETIKIHFLKHWVEFERTHMSLGRCTTSRWESTHWSQRAIFVLFPLSPSSFPS